jgi:hypothetical protein
MDSMEQWLTRTAENWIAGPYSKEQVSQMILDGRLGLQDEICPANGYWIMIHETKEIMDHLGIQVPRAHGSAEEVTESEITSVVDGPSEETVAQSQQTEYSSGSTYLARKPSRMGPKSEIPSLAASRSAVDADPNRKGMAIVLLGLVLLSFIAFKIFKH